MTHLAEQAFDWKSHSLVRKHQENARGGGKLFARLATLTIAGTLALTLMPGMATAADDGVKTYKLTGAGWVETNDDGIRWATQNPSTVYQSNQSADYSTGANMYGDWWVQRISLTQLDNQYKEVDTTSTIATFALNANGEVFPTSVVMPDSASEEITGKGWERKDIQTAKRISKPNDFVTQIGRKIVEPGSYTQGTWTLYIKARPRTAAEQGSSMTSTQMPQSGDPAAAWSQSLPLLVAVLAVAGAAGAVMVSKRRA